MMAFFKKIINPLLCVLVFLLFVICFSSLNKPVNDSSPRYAVLSAINALENHNEINFRKVVDLDTLIKNTSYMLITDAETSPINQEFTDFSRKVIIKDLKDEVKHLFDKTEKDGAFITAIKQNILPNNGFSYKMEPFSDPDQKDNLLFTVLLKNSNLLLSFVIETKNTNGHYKITNVKNLKEMLQFVMESQKYAINLKNNQVQKEMIESLPLIELKTVKSDEGSFMLTYTLQNKTNDTIKSFSGNFIDADNNDIFNVTSFNPLATMQTFGNTLKLKSNTNPENIKFKYNYVELSSKKLYHHENNIKLFNKVN